MAKGVTVKIAHICENYMGHYIYFTPQYYKKVYGKTAEYNCIMFRAKDGYSEEQVKKAGEKILAKDQVLTISYLHDIKDQLDDMLASLNLVIIVLIVSAGMLAFVVLYNLNSINITERQRELATLKVLGFYDVEVAEYVFRENILLTLIGAFVGVIFGKVPAPVRNSDGGSGCGDVWTKHLSSELYLQLFIYDRIFIIRKLGNVFQVKEN